VRWPVLGHVLAEARVERRGQRGLRSQRAAHFCTLDFLDRQQIARVEVMNTSSAAWRSPGSSGFSRTSRPGTRISSSRTSRVTPGRQPELSGGVQTWFPLAMKMLAEVHSATRRAR